MAALAVQGSPVTLGADVLARLRERFRLGEREVDEAVTLFAADGAPLPVRLLATAVPTEGDPLCYCALLPAGG